MQITPKDVPFVPGTVFADPRKQTYHKAHCLDKTKASLLINDTRAVANPIGVTHNLLCERGTVNLDPNSCQCNQDKCKVSGTICPDQYYDPSKTGSRGAIACRTHLIKEAPQGARVLDPSNPFATMFSRDHDTERTFARSVPTYAPSYVKLDGVVLRFYAWTATEVQESQSERVRVRYVMIDYCVVDGTLMIYERPLLNAGHPQNLILKRQRVPVDYRDQESGFIGIADLQVRSSIDIFGHVYNIYACSQDTRVFLEREGLSLATDVNDQELPKDEYVTTRTLAHIAETQKSIVTKHVPDDPLAKYLRHDREVLNFKAYWDNRDQTFGEIRFFTIQFFLADDTVQVIEVLPQNCGRDPFPQFVRRQKVPHLHTLTQFKEHADQTQTFFQARDIHVGEFVQIYNRQMFVYDCDDFTRQYLISELGFSPESVKRVPLGDENARPVPPTIKDLGTMQHITRTDASKLFHDDLHQIGNDEDTLGSCMSVHPIPPKKNILQWMSYGDLNLKCLAKFVPHHGKDVHVTFKDRQFIITYYFSDNSISIFEVNQASMPGFGNRFLERRQVKNIPATESQPTDYLGHNRGTVYYNYDDLRIGKQIEVNGLSLEIIRYEDQTQLIYDEIDRDGIENFNPEKYKELAFKQKPIGPSSWKCL